MLNPKIYQVFELSKVYETKYVGDDTEMAFSGGIVVSFGYFGRWKAFYLPGYFFPVGAFYPGLWRNEYIGAYVFIFRKMRETFTRPAVSFRREPFVPGLGGMNTSGAYILENKRALYFPGLLQ
ncbi:hypothetical protein HHL17_07160 [Chitinophaga sp. G-6-1-13]|uniref:Uncharacterized protein n=1 Tax=Chitinophaga fulva TaxID=2728842 RepID=A0A848GJA3_9BACT|nr:hypothetical protein [Chitinophaga fulva]NML36973.1 hypothetical protein [Chitinophaga fulva]